MKKRTIFMIGILVVLAIEIYVIAQEPSNQINDKITLTDEINITISNERNIALEYFEIDTFWIGRVSIINKTGIGFNDTEVYECQYGWWYDDYGENKLGSVGKFDCTGLSEAQIIKQQETDVLKEINAFADKQIIKANKYSTIIGERRAINIGVEK